MMNRRVVVTGLGMVSPIGNDVASSWQAALEGKSGIDRITAFDASAFGCQIAGEVKDFDAGKYLGVKEVRRFDRFVHFGVSAGIMALEDSGLEITDEFAPSVRASAAFRSSARTTRPATSAVRAASRPSSFRAASST
mgnify:CR=1 FL=1